MADSLSGNEGGDDLQGPPFPEDSVLTLGEYLDMQKAIGDETRYRLLWTLANHGDRSATELRDALDLEGNTLHYHLDRLVDVGLVQNRKRNEPTRDGLYSYYRATAMGDAILQHGVAELIQREHEFLQEYA